MTDKIDPQDDNRQVVCVSPYLGMDDEGPEDSLDLLELWHIIWGAKYFIVGFTFVATLVAALYTLYIVPVTYQSTAVLIQNGSSNGGGLSGLTTLASSLPIPLSLPGGDKVNSLLSFLQSRNLQKKLIEKYDLLPHFYREHWDQTKKKWLNDDPKRSPTVIRAIQDNVLGGFYESAQDKKTQLITIKWVDQDPAFAAEMLKRVIVELEYYLANEYVSDAKRERQFIESQLSVATHELELWEQQVPSEALTLAKIQRELLTATTVYTELRKQLELAKIAEAKELVNFKVLDEPFVPERKFKPRRSAICAMTMLLAGFLSIIIVFVRYALIAGPKKKNGDKRGNGKLVV